MLPSHHQSVEDKFLVTFLGRTDVSGSQGSSHSPALYPFSPKVVPSLTLGTHSDHLQQTAVSTELAQW